MESRVEPCFLLIFAYRSFFSLLHGSVFDQSNGTFSTTRVLDGRDPGDIGHFLVAIRQRKPPTVKTIGKKKKRREIREELKVSVSLCLAYSVEIVFEYFAPLPPSSRPFTISHDISPGTKSHASNAHVWSGIRATIWRTRDKFRTSYDRVISDAGEAE